MKRIVLTALGLALAVPLLPALSGCAAPPTPANSSYEVDTAQVVAIERAARRVGVDVIWINQPVKKLALAAGG